MPVITSYPGVYIEELFNFSLSVNASATAVPIFASSDAVVTDKAQRIDSWLAFLQLVETFDPAKKLHVAMRAYFENGGGYCYLAKPAKLAEEVPKYDDITILVAAGEDIGAAVAALCQPGNSLFAILDGPATELTMSSSSPATQSICCATYYPWLNAPWAQTGGANPAPVDIPPSAAVAGIYCSVDRQRGVWKAPANVVLGGGLTPKFKVSDALQGRFNTDTKAINMIREFRGSGALVWGARTGGDTATIDWKYIPVRRLFDAAERDIKRAMYAAVFEPNTAGTWNRVRQAIDSYLHTIWQQGGLMGARPEEGYFIRVGLGETMTQDDIDNGRMIVKIGMAAAKPAEFIILQFTQEMAQV